MKVLHVSPSFYPALYWGGPIYSTKAICDGVAAASDFSLRVLTTDAASPDRRDRVTPVSLPYPVHYTRRIMGHSVAPGLLAALPRAMAWADVVHVTATYSFPTLPVLGLARILSKPVVWSPRGALMATADWRGAPHARAKRGFEHILRVLRPADTILHVTSPQEAARSTARLGHIKTVVIPNAVTLPPPRPDTRSRDGVIRLLYLGRLHPKKGLDLLVQAVGQLPAQFQLDIYGTGDPAYVATLRGHPRVKLHGHVTGAAKQAAYDAADLFVLPSYSENFGIAVAEALAHGLPVLTTTKTPWVDLAQHGCGRCITLGQDDLALAIQELAAGDLAAMGARGRDWMRRDFSHEAMASAFAALYRSTQSRPKQEVFA